MWRHTHTARANRIPSHTHVDCFRDVKRANGGKRAGCHCPRECARCRRISEDSDGGDMIGDPGWHLRGDYVDHGRTLGVPTEDHPGVGTACRHGLGMSARVVDTGSDGTTEIVGGRVVDRIYADSPPSYLRTQGINKRLSDPPNARRLGCAPGEHHVDVGAGSRGSGWQGRGSGQQRPRCNESRTEQTRNRMCGHGVRSMLSLSMLSLRKGFGNHPLGRLNGPRAGPTMKAHGGCPWCGRRPVGSSHSWEQRGGSRGDTFSAAGVSVVHVGAPPPRVAAPNGAPG